MRTDNNPGNELTTRGFAIAEQRQQVAPSLLAEQQRAKSEIEAALTIAAARPRDEKEAVEGILVACQRPGLAEKAQYQYSRGGTNITGASIHLMETIAQKWGNIEFGFRELARLPGQDGGPGESIVEAFCWDLQTNTRRKAQFTVQHVREKRGGNAPLTDPRDIYEMIANQAQRRVRTCLENVIPRDIVEMACEQCDQTLKAEVEITPELLKKTADVFLDKFGVTKEQLEGRLQRRFESITPAQILSLRKIYTSLQDGMSEVGDWFTPLADAKPASLDELDKRLKKAPAKSAKEPAFAPEPTAVTNSPKIPDSSPEPTSTEPYAAEVWETEAMQAIGWAKTELDLQGLSNQVNRAWGEHGIDDAAKQRLQEAITAAMRALKPAGKKGQK